MSRGLRAGAIREKLSGWARRLPRNWATSHGTIIQSLKLMVNWRSGFAIDFWFLVNRLPARRLAEGNKDAPECRALTRDTASSSRAVGRCILAARVELVRKAARRDQEGARKESEHGSVWCEARLLDSAAQPAGRVAALGADKPGGAVALSRNDAIADWPWPGESSCAGDF